MAKNANNNILLTKEGLEKLKKEYYDLVNYKRSEVAEKIKNARSSGDISENGEYDSARDEQAFLEGRIKELEEILRDAKVVTSVISSSGKTLVTVGCKVRVHIDGGEEEFTIVGAPEANPLAKKISHESPLGKALMGKKVGDIVEIQAPVGKLLYKILNVT